MRPYQQCTKCILDTKDDSTIFFDHNGICNHCHTYELNYKTHVFKGDLANKLLIQRIEEIKKDGLGKKYDSIIGLSGGVDSTYVAFLAKKHNLRPLLVHFDNGWNSELAVQNIERIVQKLGFDLHTVIINWEEFKDLQLSFLKASVIDIEMLTDHSIFASMFLIAKKYGIKHTIHGMNIETEGIMMPHWVHKKNDLLNITDIQRLFGSVPLKTYPKMSYWQHMFNLLFFKIKPFDILNYVDYNKVKVKELISKELGWRDYGGKHYESIFTKFYQAYILPTKFNVDKRKVHLSTLICSGQISREQALKEMEAPIYDPVELKNDTEFVLKKLGLSLSEFNNYMKLPVKNHLDYDSYELKHWKYNDAFFSSIKPFRTFIRKLLIKKERL